MEKSEQQRKDAVVLIEEEYENRTWDDYKQLVRAKFTRLTDADLEMTQRRIEAMIVKIQEKYPEDLNLTREYIQTELDAICNAMEERA